MNNKSPDNKIGLSSDISERPDLDGEEHRDSAHYQPISTREYFKVLFYFVFGFIAVVLVLIYFTIFLGE